MELKTIRLKILELLQFLGCTLLFWTLFPLLYTILSPFYIFRLILIPLQKWLHPEWIGLMNLRDAFLYEDMETAKVLTAAIPTPVLLKYAPQQNSCCSSVETSDADADSHLDLESQFVENARDVFRKLFKPLDSKTQTKRQGQASYEKLMWYAETWFGYPFYKREKHFKLENHVKLCEEFEGREISEEEMELFIGERTSKPFPRAFSPWECLIIRIKSKSNEPGKRYAAFFRFHHMLADGLSLLPILGVLDKDQLNAKVKKLSGAKSTWRTKLAFAAKFLLFVGYDSVNLLILNKDKNLWTLPPNQLTGQTHMVSSSLLSYELVQKASKRKGASATAAIFACFAGGIHNYLKETGTQETESEQIGSIPREMQMGVAMPVPNHPLDGLVNHWTVATVNLPIGDPNSNSDSSQENLDTDSNRMEKIDKNLQHLIQRGTAGILWLIVPPLVAVPYKLECLLAYNDFTTLMGSNFPGPRGKISVFKDWDLEGCRGYLPRLRSSCAVGLSSLTYNDTVTFYLCVDKGLMPERASAKRLIALIENQLFILAGEKPRANF